MDKVTRQRFLESYSDLILSQLQERLGIATASEFNPASARFLIQAAAVLALNVEPAQEAPTDDPRAWAYDVVTRLTESFGQTNPAIATAADFILSRLGNFPGRDLLRARFPSGEQLVRRSPALRLESMVREHENTVVYPSIGALVLTDFQIRLTDSLRRSKSVSVSAPTSAGKSYVLTHDILSTIADNPGTVLVYLVPTRALIQQVTTDLLSLFRFANLLDVIVCAAPIPFSHDEAKRGIIYVLTQERLISLLSLPEFDLTVSKVYIDEAQGIGDQERGLILDSAVRSLVRRFPDVRTCFASPLTKNPGYIFSEFDLNNEGYFFTETFSPVAQVIVNLEPVEKKTKFADVHVATPCGLKSVGRLTLPFKFREVRERLAHTAILVRKPDESVIVFANRPVDAMEIAEKIAQEIDGTSTDPDVLALVEFVKTHVHAQYALADTLLKGVAFHYGKMPHIIRTQVELLLKTRKLQYVVCTSTLLQGVNLPARHIVVHAPRSGQSDSMSTPDFWNLAGRAGRLRENFSGIVWCIEPSSWESKPFEGERLSEIKSAFQTFVEDPLIRDAASAIIDGTVPVSEVQNRGRVEQFVGKAFSEFTLHDQNLADSPRISTELNAAMVVLDQKLEKLRSRLKVPEEVCSKNSVISPTLLDDLWRRFEKGLSSQMIPVDPYRPGAYNHFQVIFEIISNVFIGVDNNSYNYFANLAWRWVMGHSLKDIIENYLSFYKIGKDKPAVNSGIRSLLEAIEQTLRFTYVKYLGAYIDVLRAFLIKEGRSDEAEKLSPWDMYVEFGARDKVLIMLMSVGVSRSTAIAIRRSITAEQEISRDDCWKKLQAIPLKVLAIPEVCKQEVRQLTGSMN